MKADPGSIFDRAIEGGAKLVGAKRWARVRAHRRSMATDEDYREAFGFYAQLRGYKAAKSSKNTTPWLNESDRSADAELASDHGKMRNRSRAVQRDDALGSGIVATLKRGTVGTGLRPQPRTGKREKDDVLAIVGIELLNRADQANGLCHGDHQGMLYQRTCEDGDVLLRATVYEQGQPIAIEVIEGDRVASPLGAKPQDPRGRIVQGVEKDRYGRTVAYWVAKQHPGDVGTPNVILGAQAPRPTLGLTLEGFDRVDASTAKFVRSRVTRSGQTRGVGIFHACLQDIHDLDLLILASLKRTQVAACLAMFITSEADSTDLLQLTAGEYGYQLDQQLRPGMMFRLFPGEKLEQVDPKSNAPDLEKFVFLLARRIGAAVGLSPEAILRAWAGVSYSGARTIKIDDRQTFRGERASLSKQALAWEWRVVLEDALMRGDPRLTVVGVTLADLEWVDWIGDEEQWVDPPAEAQAIQLQLHMGLTSLQIECAKLGRDWQDVVRQKLEAEKFEAELRKSMGLPPAAPVGGVPLKVLQGGKQPADEDEDEIEKEAA